MPTIQQLPNAATPGPSDEIPISQSGVTNAVTVAALLSSTQPAIVITQNTLLGRVSFGPGGPEPVQAGTGLQIASGTLSATGSDHATYPEKTSLSLTDEAILNSAGSPRRMPLSMLSGLFSAGSNVSISSTGQISAATDPAVTTSLTAFGQSVRGAEQTANKGVAGGYAGLDAHGTVTAPITGVASLATVQANWASQGRTLAARASDAINVADLFVSGDADATPMWTRALAAAAANPGVRLYAPGRGAAYALSGPLTFAGSDLFLEGDGAAASVLAVGHSGVGLTIAQSDATRVVRLRGIGFAAAASATAALSVQYPAYKSVPAVSGRSLLLDKVQVSGGFANGITLFGVWNAALRDYEFASGSGQASGVVALSFGQCIGLEIADAQVYSAGTAFLQTDYAERVRLRGCTASTLEGFAQAAYTAASGGAGMDGNAVNLVDLRVEECDFACTGAALDLALVERGWIRHNRFNVTGASAPGAFALRLDGMALAEVSGNVVVGPGYAQVAAGQGTVGLWLRNTKSFGYGNKIGGNLFSGVATAVLLDSGAGDFQMDVPNDHFEAAAGHLDTYQDNSGTNSNTLAFYQAALGQPLSVVQRASAGFAFAGPLTGDVGAATAGGTALTAIAAAAAASEPAANKGQPNGFAALDASGHLQLGGVSVLGVANGQALLLITPPTTDPGIAGAVWNNGQYLCLSTGAA